MSNPRFVDFCSLPPLESHLAELNACLRELSDEAVQHTKESLAKIFWQRDFHLEVAMFEGEIVGAGCLRLDSLLVGGRRGYLDDVAVRSGFRGKKIGRGLTQHLVRIAQERGADFIMLTSRPARIAANATYRRLGFRLIAAGETNLYRLDRHEFSHALRPFDSMFSK